jgi:hypothetical protein
LQSYDAGGGLAWLALFDPIMHRCGHVMLDCDASRARFSDRFAAPTSDGDGSNMFTLQFHLDQVKLDK